ncbi:MAG: SWIM zinc finger family protein [Bdellovibrionota bacterium]
MSVQNWEHFFKPEVRSSGRTLFAQGKVSIAQPSDTEIVAYIRISSPLKVSLKTKSISSSTVFAGCNCPAGKKDLFCKHIWATLLAAELKNPDFFEEKTEIEKISAAQTTATAKPKTAQSQAYADKQAAYKEQQKEKQSLQRKIQYQKQKLRMNEYKKNKKDSSEQSEFPREVEKALNFFSENGFEIRESMNKETVATAKKKLARVFHPDHGGSHEEILVLNNCSEILMKFIK